MTRKILNVYTSNRHRKREEEMSSRVKSLEKLTKELLSQIALWEDQHGPFLFAVI